MPRITREEVIAAPWKYNAEQWKYAHGIHSPHIAEISPMQYWHLSKQGKRTYDAKREQEWSASAAGWEAWRDAVLTAYDAGTIDRHTPDLHPDAKSLIISADIERDKQRAEEERKQRIEDAKYHDISEIKKGDKVSHFVYGVDLDVVKVNRKTVTVAHPFGNTTIPFHQLYRTNPRTL